MDLVTGGSGFVGSHVVRALLAKGRTVRCLVRAGSRRDNLDGLPVEIAVGDLTDPASLARALSGVHALYHVAADYRLWAKDPRELYRGQRGRHREHPGRGRRGRRREGRLHELGRRARVERRRHAGQRDDARRARSASSGTTRSPSTTPSRWPLAWAAKGLPVVIVNPSTPIGERDIKPTPTGQADRGLPEPEAAGLRRHGAEPRRRARRRGGPPRRGREGPRGRALHPRQPQHDAEGDPRHSRAADRPAGADGAAAPLDPALGRGGFDRAGRG